MKALEDSEGCAMGIASAISILVRAALMVVAIVVLLRIGASVLEFLERLNHTLPTWPR